MSHNITVQGGKSIRLPTKGKYCDRDIVITAVCEEVPSQDLGQFLYRFGVLSDIHLGYESRHATTDFQRANRVLQNLGVEFVCISGDIGYYSDTSSVITELESYQTEILKYPKTPYYTCTGNHDIKHSDTDWLTYTGNPKNFTVVENGDVFIFMSLAQSEKASSYKNPYSTNLTEWLYNELKTYQGARIFLFMHYPITGYAGLQVHQSYGFSSDSSEDAVLLKMLLDTDNVTVFNGHTHYKFECEDKETGGGDKIIPCPDINVSKFANRNIAIAHIPSCAYPRNLNSTNYEEEKLSQGYVVDAYEHGVVLRAVDFVEETYMPEYEYTVMIESNPISADTSAILLSQYSVSLSSGESAEVEVSLKGTASKTITVSESNDYIEVSPTSFTLGGSNTSQIVTITAGQLKSSETAIITVSADGVTPKTISVALTHEVVEPVTAVSAGQNAPVNGTVYGTACGSATATYQLTDSKTVGNYNFTFSNLELTSNQTALYFGATGANSATGKTGTAVNITLKGNNIIDVTSGNKSQRVISSSGTSENYFIGVNDAEGNMATLTLKGTTVANAGALIKGYWIIKNAVVTAIGTMDSASGGINVVADGMVLHKNGTFSLGTSESTLATVQLLPCENGYLDVILGAAKAGATELIITPYAKDGYTLTAIKVNGVEQSVGTALKMPAKGETLTIMGVFAN